MTLKKKNPKKAGRKTKMTEETLKKLRDAFIYSMTDEEACLYAGITPKTLYNYIEKNPKFLQQKELLKKSPNIKAKVNWVKEINGGNYNASKEWLERKSRDEFSTKTETKQNIDLGLNNKKAIDILNNILD